MAKTMRRNGNWNNINSNNVQFIQLNTQENAVSAISHKGHREGSIMFQRAAHIK